MSGSVVGMEVSWPKMLICLTIGRSESIAQDGNSSLLSVLATDGFFRPAQPPVLRNGTRWSLRSSSTTWRSAAWW